jgi:hypothetical protein
VKILSEETVVRYYVERDAEETVLRKSIGFLPPYAAPCARRWATTVEIAESKTINNKCIG